MRSVDVNNVVRDVLALMAYELRSESVTLVLELDEHAPPVSSDRVQLEQVVLNLVSNAVDAMRSTPERSARTLTIRTSSEAADGVEMRVKDSGEGLPKEGQAKLFDPFFTTRNSGMGMGLSISRSIVEAHGGSLGCCANSDQGATFYFTLPTMEEVAPV